MYKNYLIALILVTLIHFDGLCVPKKINIVTSIAKGYEITKEGAWCWFADPRALHYQNEEGTINSTFIGYIDVHGNIKATQHDFLTGNTKEVLIRSWFQPDDHDNPTFLVLPDERVMIFYSRHTDEPCFYYRISENAGDITNLGPEMKIATEKNTTYPSPFILTDDPDHFYLCWRGIKWHPTIAKLSLPDKAGNTEFVWGPYQIVQSSASRPYAKYASNGKNKIYMTYTTGHPDPTIPNYIYFNYIDINSLQLSDVKNNVLATIEQGPHHVSATPEYCLKHPYAVVDNTPLRNWLWQVSSKEDGSPVIGMVRIDESKKEHDYFYAEWNGLTWKKTFVANGGGHFHQSSDIEHCYSGGMAIDDQNPNEVYCSVPINGDNGNVYEIVKYKIEPNGSAVPTDTLTSNSKLNNIRPYIVPNRGNTPIKLTWMYGNYYDWIVSKSRPLGFPTSIHCDYKIKKDGVNLKKGLMVDEEFDKGMIRGNASILNKTLITDRKTYAIIPLKNKSAFSISLTPYIDADDYSGTLIQMGDLTFGLNGATLKPYISIGDNTIKSTNILGSSDVWQSKPRSTDGVWYDPQKFKFFNITLTYADGKLTTYINGLIDQVVDVELFNLDDLKIGGFKGKVRNCLVYSRRLNQQEIKTIVAQNIESASEIAE